MVLLRRSVLRLRKTYTRPALRGSFDVHRSTGRPGGGKLDWNDRNTWQQNSGSKERPLINHYILECMLPSTTHLWRHQQQLILCSKRLRGYAIIRWWRQSLSHYREVTRGGSLERGMKAFWVVTACITETAQSFGGDMFLRNVGVTIHFWLNQTHGIFLP
jgi:hypothetical protein